MGLRKEMEAINNITKAERDIVNNVCDMIRKHNVDVRKYFADVVAALCEVDVDALLSTNVCNIHLSQSRWLYWYALRRFSQLPYNKIAELQGGFTVPAVSQGVNKMILLIDRDMAWKRRWCTIKKIIDGVEDGDVLSDGKQREVQIVVSHPSDVSIICNNKKIKK